VGNVKQQFYLAIDERLIVLFSFKTFTKKQNNRHTTADPYGISAALPSQGTSL